MEVIKWEPTELDLEVSVEAWDRAVKEVETWNLQTFSSVTQATIWVAFNDVEVVEALLHYGFSPLVKGLLKAGEPDVSMALHYSPRRVISPVRFTESTSSVREEKVAVTISDRRTGQVRFAVAGAVPEALKLAAKEPLTRARAAANVVLAAHGISQ